MASPDFWQGGFDVLSGMMDELEALSSDGGSDKRLEIGN
jgi:hypothetical protein